MYFWTFPKTGSLTYNCNLPILKIQYFKDKFEYKSNAYENILVLQTNTDYA